jgi:hypothetical protein
MMSKAQLTLFQQNDGALNKNISLQEREIFQLNFTFKLILSVSGVVLRRKSHDVTTTPPS